MIPALLVACALVLATGAQAEESTVLEPVADTTLYEDDHGYGTGAGDFLFVGPISSGSPRRVLLRFDLGALPANAVIASVSLHFTVNRAAFGSELDDQFHLHRIASDWGEGTGDGGTGGTGGPAGAGDATWSHRHWGAPAGSGPQWVTPGGDFVALPSASASVGSVGNYVFASSAGLVADVATWLADPAANHGWILRGPEDPEDFQKARRLIGRSSPAIEQRPRLTIVWTAPAAGVATAQAPIPLAALLGLASLLVLLAGRYVR